MITLTSTEAQNRFGEVLDIAQREPVTITRRGRPLAFIISPDELHKLFSDQKKREEAVLAYEAGLTHETVMKKLFHVFIIPSGFFSFSSKAGFYGTILRDQIDGDFAE